MVSVPWGERRGGRLLASARFATSSAGAALTRLQNAHSAGLLEADPPLTSVAAPTDLPKSPLWQSIGPKSEGKVKGATELTKGFLYPSQLAKVGKLRAPNQLIN